MNFKVCADGTPAPFQQVNVAHSLPLVKQSCPWDACLSCWVQKAPARRSLSLLRVAIQDCRVAFCTTDLKICPDGTPAPITVGECCPSFTACGQNSESIKPIQNSLHCCVRWSRIAVSRRSNPLDSLLSSGDLFQTLSSAKRSTDLGSVISILNLLNNVQQLSNDNYMPIHLSLSKHLPICVTRLIKFLFWSTKP